MLGVTLDRDRVRSQVCSMFKRVATRLEPKGELCPPEPDLAGGRMSGNELVDYDRSRRVSQGALATRSSGPVVPDFPDTEPPKSCDERSRRRRRGSLLTAARNAASPHPQLHRHFSWSPVVPRPDERAMLASLAAARPVGSLPKPDSNHLPPGIEVRLPLERRVDQ
jgi:hypothetical protein